jgi:carbamoyl-phosphate synthase large subunit
MQPTDFMAAEMLPGREFAFQSIWQNGKLIAGQARERVEYLYGFLTPSGQTSTPAVARTVSDASITDLAIMSITALDEVPNGIYCADIKESASGIPMVTEINAGRFFTTSNFFSTAGLNMPDMAMRAAAGEQLQEVGLSPLDDDLYWIRMVDMQYKLVPGDQLDNWTKFDR